MDDSSCDERRPPGHPKLEETEKLIKELKEGAFQMTNKHDDKVRKHCCLVLEVLRVNRDDFGGLR